MKKTMEQAVGEKVFTHAIVRKLGENFFDGITTSNLGAPDHKKALEQHDAYCDGLKKCGLNLVVLEPEPLFPDAPFVEDTAVLGKNLAVITRLGDNRRQGEEKEVASKLLRFFRLVNIIPPGMVEGGDVLRVGSHYYIGISERTNEAGANQLARHLSHEGLTSSFIPVSNILHLKTGVTYIGNNTMIAIQEFAELKEFKKFHTVVVDQDENYAANCLLINDNLFIPRGFPKTRAKIQKLGHIRNIIEVEASEFQKMDGGLTCLSVLF